MYKRLTNHTTYNIYTNTKNTQTHTHTTTFISRTTEIKVEMRLTVSRFFIHTLYTKFIGEFYHQLTQTKRKHTHCSNVSQVQLPQLLKQPKTNDLDRHFELIFTTVKIKVAYVCLGVALHHGKIRKRDQHSLLLHSDTIATYSCNCISCLTDLLPLHLLLNPLAIVPQFMLVAWFALRDTNWSKVLRLQSASDSDAAWRCPMRFVS